MPGRDYTEAFARLSPTIQDIFQTYEAKSFGLGTAHEPDLSSWPESLSFVQPPDLPKSEFKQSNEQAASISQQNPSFDLPPTPPQNVATNAIEQSNATVDSYQTSPNALSGVSTPTNKKSLPTPDVTPPSTVQEPGALNLGSSLSFQTAREDPMSSTAQSFSSHRTSDDSDIASQETLEFPRRDSERSEPFDLIDPGVALLPEARRTPSLKNRPDVKALVGHWERESKRYSIVSDADTYVSSNRPRDSAVSPISPVQNGLRWIPDMYVEDEAEETEKVDDENSVGKVFDEPIGETGPTLPFREMEDENYETVHTLPLQEMKKANHEAVGEPPMVDLVPEHVPTPDTSIFRGPTPDRVKTNIGHHDPQSEEPSPLTPADHAKMRNEPESEEPSPITPTGHRGLEKLIQEVTRDDHERKFSSNSSPGSSRTTIVNAIVVDTSSLTSLPRLRHVAKTRSLRGAASESDGSNRASLNSDDSTPHRLTRKKNMTPERRVKYSVDQMHNGALKGLGFLGEHEFLASRPRTAPERYDSPVGMLSRDLKKSEITRESILPSSRGAKRLSDPLRSQVVSSAMYTDLSSKTGSLEIPIILEEHPDFKNLHHFSRESRQRNDEQPWGSGTDKDANSAWASPLMARFSMDRSTIATESLPRPSLEQTGLTPANEGKSTAHQVFTLTSPITLHSNFSTLEVHEATAVSIYPHTNNSLLMVHHNALEDPLKVHLNPSKSQTTITKAIIQTEPSGPDQARLLTFPDRRDSPLMNPRAAPDPPAVAVIPPTPARELDATDTTQDQISVPKHLEPSRGSTLVNRARRYSGSVLNPIVSSFGAGTLTRRNTRARYYYRTGSRRISSAPNVGRNSNLHPLWRPRRFWEEEEEYEEADELNNKHDEFGDKNEPYDNNEYTNRRIPTRSKAREVAGLPKYNNNSHWRRGGSLRGFLIGNTLGLERGPTNRRRHVVALPAGMKGKTAKARAKGFAKKASRAPVSSTQASPSIVTVRDSVRRSGSGRRRRRSRHGTNLMTFSTKWPFKSWRGMIEQHQLRQIARHEDENL